MPLSSLCNRSKGLLEFICKTFVPGAKAQSSASLPNMEVFTSTPLYRSTRSASHVARLKSIKSHLTKDCDLGNIASDDSFLVSCSAVVLSRVISDGLWNLQGFSVGFQPPCGHHFIVILEPRVFWRRVPSRQALQDGSAAKLDGSVHGMLIKPGYF